MTKRTAKGIEFEVRPGNVFADLGFPDAEELQIKSGLAIEIISAIRRLGLTQQQAAKQMGISQSKVSGLIRADFTNLSETKLMECLNRLGYDIEIKLRPTAESIGRRIVAIA